MAISITATTSSGSTVITSSTVALAATEAQGISVQPYGSITANNIQEALQQLADQNFRSSSTPTGSNVEEGDTWYDTSTEQFKVYRETSTGNFQWVPIMLGAPGGDSDTQDAGTF